MKESTGELTMVIVVIVGVLALAGIIRWLFVGDDAPAREWIEGQWGQVSKETTKDYDNG